MIASTQIKQTDIFALIAVLVLKLLSRKVLFIYRKDNRNVGYLKSRLLLKKMANFTGKLLQNYKLEIAKFSGNFKNTQAIIY